MVTLATTNRPNMLDPALMRPGRFDIHIHIGSPDAAARREILAIHTRNQPLAADVDLDALSVATEERSRADLAGVCRVAGMAAVRRLIRESPDGNHDLSKLAITQEDQYTALGRRSAGAPTKSELSEQTVVRRPELRSGSAQPIEEFLAAEVEQQRCSGIYGLDHGP
jgi:SpoVK/Ycf46/Vps4 family AAA+-type ATPase